MTVPVTALAAFLVMLIALAVIPGALAFNTAAIALIVPKLMPALVMVTALVTLAVMVAAVVTLTVMVPVMVAVCVGIVGKFSFSKGLCRCVSRALDAAIEPNPCFGQGHLSAHTNTAADQSVHLRRLQDACQRTVAVAVCFNDLLAHNLSFFHVVKLELFGMSEMLEDFSVFKSDCDSHSFGSFLHNGLVEFHRLILAVSAGNQKPLPVNDDVSYLFSGGVIDRRDGGT